MPETMQPIDCLNQMIAASNAGDMPALGTFTSEYGDAIADQITPLTLDAFIEGAAVVNLLVQEIILNALTEAAKIAKDVNSDDEAAYVSGLRDGVMGVCTLLDAAAAPVLGSVTEPAFMDREFAKITEGIDL